MKRMKLLVVVALALVICMPGLANAYFIQTFDSGNADFKAVTINGGTLTELAAPWSGSGGDPDGHIYAGVDNTVEKRYSFANWPSNAIYGNLNGAYLTTSFKTEGTITTSNPLVRFYVGTYTTNVLNVYEWSYYVTKDAYSWDPNSDTNWTMHSVYVTAANFIPWPGFDNTKTFAEVMAGHEDIGLVFAESVFANATLGFSSSAGATLRVDNFGSSGDLPVPLPPSVLLLGSGILGLVGLGWRRSRKES